MPDKIITLNDILGGVFCKSGKKCMIFTFCSEKQKKFAIKLNRKRFNLGGGGNNLKQYYTYCFYA